MAARILRRLSVGGAAASRALMVSTYSRPDIRPFPSHRRLFLDSSATSPIEVLRRVTISFNLGCSGSQIRSFSSSSFPLTDEKEADEKEGADEQAAKSSKDADNRHRPGFPKRRTRRRSSVKRTAFSDDSDSERDLSVDDLAKLVAEKEELLKLKHKEVEKMQEKVLLRYADIENVIDRTKRETENSKKFAIQNFAKSLIDVADNLGRALAVVKESSSKTNPSESDRAANLLKTLLEGVEMTEKQLIEVFRKFGVEKFDPSEENFDPHRHLALFEIPDDSKPPGAVGAVLKAGYMLHERVLRPAEVGVIKGASDEPAGQTSGE